ncbi:hypothetical protein BGX27_000940 [Mortierella sp. AM989]|nr:hypothetical protein BGX27_000940 [Mortierella sp. AM989]
MIIGLLAILKAGGAYVPLDPSFASERLHDILADAAPSILLADKSGNDVLSLATANPIVVIDPNMVLDKPTVNPYIEGLTSSHLAYVMYTSGSTGKPKGVMVEHTQVVRLFDATSAWYNLDARDTWIMTHTFSFDISVWEIWGALRYGSRLIIPSYRTTQSSEDFYKLICKHGVTVFSITPSALRPLIRLQAHSDLRDQLRYIILVGEAHEPSMLKSLYDTRPRNSLQIVNMYGPTETTVYAAYRVMKEEDCNNAFCPIGVRIPDLKVYVLDTHGRPVPLGAVGELCIGGAGVTRGYLNRPELTSEKFPLDPFSKTEGARMYKTGDLVRYLPDGDLIFLGRNDHQVKIRGYRIELGEIEARLSEHSIVREAVVLAIGEGADKRLVAYVVAEATERLAHSLRSHVSSKLPDYMVPSAFVRVDALPLTSNGKLDRRALPAPDIDAYVSQGYESPQGEIESTLATIWAKLLKVERVGRHDNFFMLGGHSLIAVKLIGIVRSKLGLDLKLQTLFEAPTIAELMPRIIENPNNKQEEVFDVLLPLKSQGNRPPIFCIHPVFGLSWSFIGLSKHLHSEQPLYALQSRGLDGNGQPASSIEEMVWDYIDQILQVQPRGPYHLLGWSFGGSIAHSMAVQLENLGEKVTLLALMDSTSDYSMLPKNTEVGQDESHYSEHLARSSDRNTVEEGKELWRMTRDVYVNNMRLARQFTPSVYTGDMLFFRASESASTLDPSMWAPFTLGEIEVHQVKCEHLEMDKPKPIAEIGHILATRLEDLDDIIKAQRQEKKSKPKPAHVKTPAKPPAGIQSRSAAIRTAKNGKGAAKSASPYARPGTVKKETALFTESYKAAKAPVTEIFTAGYIPKPATTLKLFTTNYKKGGSAPSKREEDTTGPLTTKSLRLVTTQAPRRETVETPAPKIALTTQRNNRNGHSENERIPTGPRIPGQSVSAGLNRGGDFYRPNDRNDRNDRNERNERIERNERNDRNSRNDGDDRREWGEWGDRNERNERFERNDRNDGNGHINKGNDRRGGNIPSNPHSGRGVSPQQQIGRNQIRSNNAQGFGSSPRIPEQRNFQDDRSQQVQPVVRVAEVKPAPMDMDMDMDMEADEGMVSIKGSAPNTNVIFRGESGPVTIEIENLDPGTTADDVKYVCSKFGEIKSCMCTNGFAQVTYARKAAGLAAIENLHGKKADNGKILRVTMRKTAILHEESTNASPHAPSPIAGPMKILTKAVQGTITNAGTLYSDQLLAAQHMLKVQQHRMAQLHREEQRISSLRMQTEPQLSNLNSLSSSGVHRGFF